MKEIEIGTEKEWIEKEWTEIELEIEKEIDQIEIETETEIEMIETGEICILIEIKYKLKIDIIRWLYIN